MSKSDEAAIVRFEGVSKIFPNGYIGLDDVSFSIQPKTLTYIVGESGAGKTTLMRLLIRELQPSSGEIFLEDQPISDIKLSKVPFLRRKVAVIFQDYKLIPERTVAENLALALDIIGTKKKDMNHHIDEVLDLVGLKDRGDMFPNQLSGGELQRVAIARALVMSPKIIFADEPTGNLDTENAKSIGELLKKVTELGTTVLVATHDQNLLKKFPAKEIHIHKGKIVKEK